MTEHRDIKGNDIIKTMRIVKEKPKPEEKARPWWRPQVSAFKTEISYGAERVRSWLVSLKWWF